MRCAGLGTVHCDHDLTDTQLALSQKREDLEATGIGHGLEYLSFGLYLCLVKIARNAAQLIDLAFRFICVSDQPHHPVDGLIRYLCHKAMHLSSNSSSYEPPGYLLHAPGTSRRSLFFPDPCELL